MLLNAGLAIKNPPKKSTQKTHLKKPIKNNFFVLFLIFFYENNSNFFVFETDFL
jgi:hypothetical protein